MITVPLSAASDVQLAIRQIEGVLSAWTGPNNVDLHGRRLINAGDALQAQDYVTAAQLRAALAGVEPAPPPPPRDVSLTVLYGTHAERTATAPQSYPLGTLFWEIDRAAFYQVQTVTGLNAWVLALCRPLRTSDTKPADLGTNDVGFTWFQSDAGYTWRWSGGAWNYYLGSYVDVFANRPDPALADRGMLFIASDRGYHVWRKGASTWILLEGVGGPTRGVIASLTGSLAADDVGYQYYATDFDRTYRWDGAAYADAPNQPKRGLIAHFMDTILPGTGWQLCDGTAGVSISTATGGTTTFTAPNLTGSNRFIRSVSGTTGGTGGAATTHTHPVDPPNTTSSGPSTATTGGPSNNTTTAPTGTVEVAAVPGGGTFVATDTHTHGMQTHTHDRSETHDVNIASFTSGTPSGTGGDDALSPYLNLRPYIRL